MVIRQGAEIEGVGRRGPAWSTIGEGIAAVATGMEPYEQEERNENVAHWRQRLGMTATWSITCNPF